jgi:hypothetical protein
MRTIHCPTHTPGKKVSAGGNIALLQTPNDACSFLPIQEAAASAPLVVLYDRARGTPRVSITQLSLPSSHPAPPEIAWKYGFPFSFGQVVAARDKKT